MADIRLIADIHISPKTVADLQQQGWDIIRVPDILPATAYDTEILDFARAENRVFLTHDLDFSMLLTLGGYNQPSLITLRLSYQKMWVETPSFYDGFTDFVLKCETWNKLFVTVST